MLLLAALLVGASGASSGPDLGERAVAVDLAVKDVVVFSDRARVTRKGVVKFGAGVGVFRAPDLPGAVLLDSVRVTSTATKVVRVETRPVERERWSIDQVDAWIVELEALNDKIAVASGKLAIARDELALLANLTVAPPMEEKDRKDKPTSPSPEAWKEAQVQLAKRRAAARVAELTAERELRGLVAQLERAQREVQKRDLGGFTDHKIEVLVIVEGDAGSGDLAVEYAVPGAFWKPAYDLFFDPDKNNVELKASGLVTQATGEDWNDVKLALSTAIPGRGIDLPQLRTWTLGDDREYVPYATARAQTSTARPFQPPAAKPRLAEIEKEADRELLATRSQLLMDMASAGPPDIESLVANQITISGSVVLGGESSGSGGLGLRGSGAGGGGSGYGVGLGSVGSVGHGSVATPRPSAPAMKKTIDFSDDSIEGDLMQPDGAYLESRNAPAAAPEADYDEEVSVTRTTSSVSGAVSEKQRESVRRRGLALRGGMNWRQPTFADPLLPAVTAGGFDYVYDAPVVVSVPTDASGLRVPLAVRSYDVTTFYEATPSLATTAYLKATVKNGSKLPILAGPANVFVKRTFSGDANLATTGPGGALELPLGADEDIRLTRTVVPSTKTVGMFFGEEDVTDYAVKIEIGNYKKRAVTVRIVDQLPKTNAEKLKVEMVVVSPKPQEAPDADGLVYWHVDVPAGGVKQVTFTYRITRPKNWKLSQ